MIQSLSKLKISQNAHHYALFFLAESVPGRRVDSVRASIVEQNVGELVVNQVISFHIERVEFLFVEAIDVKAVRTVKEETVSLKFKLL